MGGELPPDACKRVRRKECSEAYSMTEKDCAADAVGRRVWLGQQKGVCVRCQHLVEAYRRLRERCPMLQELRSSLQSTLAELTELVDFPHLTDAETPRSNATGADDLALTKQRVVDWRRGSIAADL